MKYHCFSIQDIYKAARLDRGFHAKETYLLTGWSLEHLGPQEANSEGGEDDDDDWYDNIIGLNGKKRHKSNNYLISCDSSATDAKLSELPP